VDYNKGGRNQGILDHKASHGR